MVTLTSIALLSSLLSGIFIFGGNLTDRGVFWDTPVGTSIENKVDGWSDNSIVQDPLPELAIELKQDDGGKMVKIGDRELAIIDSGETTVTAYSSTIDQTDDSPFIMASGKHVYNGAVAANFLPFGTKVRFPEIYGDKIFIVEDRMNKRYSDRMDIWMESREKAMKFGRKTLKYEVVGEESNLLASAQ